MREECPQQMDICNVPNRIQRTVLLPRLSVSLVSRRAWCGSPLAFEAEQNLLEAGQVSCARARPRNGFALRVLQLDDLADALPCRALRERCVQGGEEFFLEIPECFTR